MIVSGNAENYAKVQMDTVSAKASTVEEKKALLEQEMEAENGHIEALKERRQAATDEEVKNQLDAQIAAAEAKASNYQSEIDQLAEHNKKVLEQKQLDNEEDMLLLGEHIDNKQSKLLDMYATDEENWTADQKKKAKKLKGSIEEELDTYTKYASDKVGKAVELSSKLNENSTQEEKDAAAAAMREAQSTLEIMGQNVNEKLATLQDLKDRKAKGEKGITDDMIKEAERQAVEAEKGYGKVAKKIEKSWKDLPDNSKKTAVCEGVINANLIVWSESNYGGSMFCFVRRNPKGYANLLFMGYLIHKNLKQTSQKVENSAILNTIPSDFVYEKATFYCNVDKINIRRAPTLQGEQTGDWYEKGMHVYYDGYVKREGYVWISWISGKTKHRHWMAVGELDANGINTHPYGTFR